MAKPEQNLNINSVSRISDGTVFRGEIYSPHDLRIDGTFSGKVYTEGRIVIGETAHMDGDVACDNTDVWGDVKGNLYVKDTLSQKNGCSMNGGLHVKKLFVELGATFNGTCRMITDEQYDSITKDLKTITGEKE